MALESRSIDEETTGLADAFDNLVAPKKIWRNHNNKLYLVLRAFGAGKVGITDAALALRNRYDPLYCEDIDLYSTAKLVGTDFKQGTGSIVRITILNKDAALARVLPAGVYNYQSASGMIFFFETANDYEFDPRESRVVSAISRKKGSFPVAQNAAINLFRGDGASINKSFVFSCEDNSGRLGYRDESAEPREYDGLPLGPKELLVTVTGVPTDTIADIVAGEVLYTTHITDPENVVYYYNELYVNGRYPVYYRFHTTTDFSLSILYQYDQDKLKASQIEEAVRTLFKPYTHAVTHIDVFSEEDAYKILSNLNLPNVRILDANVLNDADEEVPYIRIPRTRLPRLTGITFTAVETGGQT